MTPDETVQAAGKAIHDLPGFFMLDPKTIERGAELGFPGAAFYHVGRCGVLGRVVSDVAAAALFFVNPDTVRVGWRAAVDIMDPRDASAIFAACGHTWARSLPDSLDVERLAALAGAVVRGGRSAGAPLFAGWRAMPEPRDLKALALHRLIVLRELQVAMLGVATLAVGLAPFEAVMASKPELAGVYGWAGNMPEPDGLASRWHEAEALGQRLLAPAFAHLADAERSQFAALADEALAVAHDLRAPLPI